MNCLPQPCDGCTYGTGSVWCCPPATSGGSGSGTGGTWLIEGHGHPDDVIGAPSDPTHMWKYFDLDTMSTEYTWSVELQDWI